MPDKAYSFRRGLLGATALTAALSVFAAAAPARAQAQALEFNQAAQPLASALRSYSATADQEIMFADNLVAGRTAPELKGAYTAEGALLALLDGTGLTVTRTTTGVLLVQKATQDPQSGSAAGGGAEVEALIVTAQKREEDIQDVPIAISAFTQEALERSQVAGGPDLITQVPNFSFTKTNFSSYSIQIRGIGTQAISATTDPAVAVAFNNTPFIRNRFFEQEFYDLQRVEVLRGPQGTLYGRNATAGVVNIISQKPKFVYEAKATADIGNYSSSRLEAMANFPLVEDKVALRVAGAWTKREGYAFNQMTGEQIDGRDLWSTRLSLRFEPTDWISANLIWEHFEEDDDRLRSGKQLCKKHVVTHVGDLPMNSTGGSAQSPAAYVAQGCTAVSLYSPEAFQTPNGDSLPYFAPLSDLGLPIINVNPYLSETQSRDLRVIESGVEPEYRAQTDIAELQIAIDLSDTLTLNSETSYGTDSLFSLQDYNRFTTTSGVFDHDRSPTVIDENGFFCDPQLGCSDRLLLVDLSTSESSQFSQEFRLGSDFEGPFNFSFGVNYLRHDALDKYYVFINNVSLWSEYQNATTASGCAQSRGHPGDVGETARIGTTDGVHSILCAYMDPNPIGSLNDMGRNYFLSKNPYKLISYAVFGEAYYNITPDLKLTGGLRFTVDRKTAPQIPSWLLAAPEDGPYPTTQTIVQEWREPTGRLALDWKPVVPFTDETLIYASYAHGYKAGGANPPPPVFSTYGGATALGKEILPDTFDPEFIDAFELGAKNTLFDGAVTLNLTGFYYDYKGYQVSEIRNRSAVNSNYDAEVWGAEIEADWRATDALRLGFKGGYEKTRIADGEEAIDLMDRTAGNPDWMVIRPFPAIPSNCILPLSLLTAGGVIHAGFPISGRTSWDGDCVDAYYRNIDPLTQLPYVPNPTEWFVRISQQVEPLPPEYDDYPGFDPSSAPNGGRGFAKDLSGNELPNAPQFTATATIDYTMPLRGDWLVALHGDYHWQSKSYWRVFNDLDYDRLEAFSTVNAAAIFTNDAAGWKVMAYIKNVFDETALTGAFLNSDDSGLTTNVFLTEPRLYGVRVTKDFTGSILGWTGDNRRHAPGEPHPFEVELGGGMSRFDGAAEIYQPDWVTPVLAGPMSTQDNDLDWGDIRSVKFTYRPANEWKVSASYLYGKTNGQGRDAAYEDVEGGLFFFFGPITPTGGQERDHDNYLVSTVHDAEEHEVADFMVGKDVGLGAFGEGGRSTLSAGVRYASFESTSAVAINGTTGAYTPAAWAKYSSVGQHYDVYTTTLKSAREFEGVGPAVSWESSLRLAGSEEAGHADVDWKVGGGVLFGKQTAESTEERFGRYYDLQGTLLVFTDIPEAVHYDDVIVRSRSEEVTVPNLSLSLGLSYTVDRVKVSAGYAYDRFFDAIDGGHTETQQYDRSIQGPYFKLSVGFGG